MSHLNHMLVLARDVLQHTYSPYSNFPVSCVVRTADNQIFCGVNMENAAYPEGICAETAALGAMVTAGKRAVVEVVICSPAQVLCFPCGGCRQRLAEFSTAETIVHIAHAVNDVLQTTRMAELLPHSFNKQTLGA